MSHCKTGIRRRTHLLRPIPQRPNRPDAHERRGRLLVRTLPQLRERSRQIKLALHLLALERHTLLGRGRGSSGRPLVRVPHRARRRVERGLRFVDVRRDVGVAALFEEELWCRAFSVALTMRVGGRSVPLRLRCTSRAREGLRNSIHAILCSVSKRWHRPQLHGGNHLDRGVPSKYRPCKYIEHISIVWLMDNSLGCFL